MSSMTPIKAAQYVRMSTEKQIYSTHNQKLEIGRFADKHGFEIVRTYADEGRSGLHLRGRKGLQQMLSDVLAAGRDFDAILVYDVSRWGRFQDTDESAHYEFLCRQAGVPVLYCAEQFPNDGSMFSALMKSLKRAMAGEYSRELSAKVQAGHLTLLKRGYHMGGRAMYGLRRQLLDRHGHPKSLLLLGEEKSQQMERVILVPGPEHEVAIIRRIFDLTVRDRLGPLAIANLLNKEGVPSGLGRPWHRQRIKGILRNEKYIGNLVYGRKSGKLKSTARTQPVELWTRARRAVEPIIDIRTFRAAERQRRRPTDAEMLAQLAALAEKHGHLSGDLINAAPGMPGTTAYAGRFGSLSEAYALVGRRRDKDMSFVPVNRMIRQIRTETFERVMATLEQAGRRAELLGQPFTLRIAGLVVTLSIARCIWRGNKPTWITAYDREAAPDVMLYGFMGRENKGVTAFYLLPRFLFHPTGRTRYLTYDLPLIADRKCGLGGLTSSLSRLDDPGELGSQPLGRLCR